MRDNGNNLDTTIHTFRLRLRLKKGKMSDTTTIIIRERELEAR